MTILDYAIDHIRSGRPVFPGVPDEKIPAFKNPYALASTKEDQIVRWWKENPKYNILLPMGIEVTPGKFLGAIDFDRKDDRDGFETAEKLAAIGLEFPETLEQITPNNGAHKIYYFDFPIGNGVNSIGLGIDHRGFHGFIVGVGSWYHGKEYIYKNKTQICQAPQWASERLRVLGAQRVVPVGNKLHVVHDYDSSVSEKRATSFLRSQSPARAGERNRRAFEAACRLKDFGVTQRGAYDLMSTEWKAEPALEPGELSAVVNSAFQYGQNAPGIDAVETIFEPLPSPKPEVKPRHPIDQINDEYAFVTAGGSCRIIWETKGYKGEDRVEHLSLQSFHDKLSNQRITVGEKPVAISKMWVQSTKRREYEGIIFAPNYTNRKFFNVWRGFAVSMPTDEPSQAAKDSLAYFIEHIRENVCDGDLELTKWFIGFFAHMIQFPEKKPRVALALRGKKGVGKNVITECVGRLLGTHYLLAANRRYLSGNFNAHLENKILLVLDEAYWSGDKAAEGILKDLITGSTQQIERKGYESYSVANLIRVVIFGNEDWIVPASEDERRYAVFEMGEKRREDSDFFGVILDGMREHGADQLLFKYLMEFDLTGVDVNKAPKTDALMGQKEQTLEPFKAWWLGCLKTGSIDDSGDWPLDLPCGALREAFFRYVREQNYRGKLPDKYAIGRILNQILSSLGGSRAKREGGIVYAVYDIPALEKAREDWEKFIGGKVKWDMIEKLEA